MAEIDPEKILAELEAARIATASRARSRPGRNMVFAVVTLLIFAIAAFALWLLATLLEGMPKPANPHSRPEPQAETAWLPAGRNAQSRFL